MTTEQQTPQDLQQQQSQPKPSRPGSGATRAILVLFLVFAAVIAVVVYTGILSRTASAASLERETHADAVLAVSVVHPKTGGAEEDVVLPGNTQAFTDSPIYARTTGY